MTVKEALFCLCFGKLGKKRVLYGKFEGFIKMEKYVKILMFLEARQGSFEWLLKNAEKNTKIRLTRV